MLLVTLSINLKAIRKVSLQLSHAHAELNLKHNMMCGLFHLVKIGNVSDVFTMSPVEL